MNFHWWVAVAGVSLAGFALSRAVLSLFRSKRAESIEIRLPSGTVKLDSNKPQDAEKIIEMAAKLSAEGMLSAEAEVVPKNEEVPKQPYSGERTARDS